MSDLFNPPLNPNFNCLDSCFTNSENKFLTSQKKCIDDCTKDNKYKYEYDNICYDSCPENTILQDNQYLCKDLECPSLDFLRNQCNLDNSNEIDLMAKKIINDIV